MRRNQQTSFNKSLILIEADHNLHHYSRRTILTSPGSRVFCGEPPKLIDPYVDTSHPEKASHSSHHRDIQIRGFDQRDPSAGGGGF